MMKSEGESIILNLSLVIGVMCIEFIVLIELFILICIFIFVKFVCLRGGLNLDWYWVLVI